MAKNKAENFSYLRKENLALFTKPSLDRGKRYYLDNKVVLTYIDEEKGELHANVKGTSLYAVRIDFQHDLVKKAICNCPYHGAGYCKHIAATLFMANREQIKKEGNTELSLYEKIHQYASRGSAERSIVSYLNASFQEIKDVWGKKEIEENEIPYLLKQIYEVAHDYFFIENSALGEDAIKRICEFNLSFESIQHIYDSLFAIFFGEGRNSFFLAAIKNESFKKAAINNFLKAMEERRFYEFRSPLATKMARQTFLSSLSRDDLERLLSSSFGFLFSANELMEEIVKRNEYDLLTSFLNNPSEAYDADFLWSLGNLLASRNRIDESKAVYEKMLYSRGLNLEEFLTYYRMLNEQEIAERNGSFGKIASLRGFDNAFLYLSTHDQSLIKKFDLYDFSCLYQEILSSDFPYENYLEKRIQWALNKKNSSSFSRVLLQIFKHYPKNILALFCDDNRLYQALGELSFGSFFAIMHEKGMLESIGFVSWRE